MAYGADAMGEEQPAFVEFDGRAAISDLDELPRIFGLHDHLAEAPFVEVVRQDEVQALIVVARDHRIAPADLSRKKRSEEHPSELQSLMRISSAVFCLKKNKYIN